MPKKCFRCKRIKRIKDFNRNSSRPDGLQQACRTCQHDYARIYQPKSDEHIVICSYCGIEIYRKARHKRTCCRSCAQKIARSDPVFVEQQRIRAREQVLRQGGIKNGHRFTTEEVKGEANHNWKGGISKRNTIEYHSPAYVQWRRAIFIRDKFTCQHCGQIGKELQAHHILPRSTHKHLVYDITNGLTLCKACHQQTDSYAGRAHKLKRTAIKRKPSC